MNDPRDPDARDGARPEDVDALRARREVLPGDLQLALVADLPRGRVRRVDDERDARSERVQVRVHLEKGRARRRARRRALRSPDASTR